MPRRRAEVQLDPESLLTAYANGAFPMADPDTGRVSYYQCDPRCIIPLDDRFHVPKSLARVVRSGRFDIRTDTSFERVMRECATDRNEDNRSWISEDIIAAYTTLHRLGFAHSVEAWRDHELVGGLYGVSLGEAFFGESMFSRPAIGGRDASKVCLVTLIDILRRRGFRLLDSQYANDHIVRFGAIEVPATEYMTMLAETVLAPAAWGKDALPQSR
ncbi:MAG: leucyl/phenylalanyl-tRNA--protein transferase [Phycisphaerae bacterium]|jgi:leucyl/phenylalanyl-tRNA--protein transferase|nr:leucyl/phenylalanyl-tRNA--protein transferase [Phycisphaerae bacterium]